MQAVGNPASALPQSKSGHPHGYSRHLCFGWYVAGDNLTSPDFTWWKKWLQQPKHRKPGVTKNTGTSQEGWPGWGKDSPMQKRNVCWSKAQSSELLLSLGTPSVQDDRIINIFTQAMWYDAPHQTSSARHLGQWMVTAMNPNAKPAARGIKLVPLLLERIPKPYMVEVGILYSFSPVQCGAKPAQDRYTRSTSSLSLGSCSLPIILESLRPGTDLGCYGRLSGRK